MDSSEETEIMNTNMTGRMAIAASTTNSRFSSALVAGRIRLICASFFFMIATPPQNTALSESILETMKLASRMVMQQATDWKVDTAAVLPMGALPCSAA